MPARLGDLDRHFAGADPAVRAAFDRVLAAVSGFGPAEVHTFRLTSPSEVDAEFTGWLGEAYRVGARQHRRRGAAGR